MVLQYPFLIMQDVNLASTTNMKEMLRTLGTSLTDFIKYAGYLTSKTFTKGRDPLEAIFVLSLPNVYLSMPF